MNMQVLDSRRDLPSGYKVDVNRGKRDGRFSGSDSIYLRVATVGKPLCLLAG